MAYGIGSVIGDIDQKVDTYRNNPEALMQMYQQNQQLVDLLALQKLKTEKEAAMRDMQLKSQVPAATIKDQREQEVMGMMRNEVAQQIAPGLQAMAQQSQAQAQPQGGGISSVPAPNMQDIGMAGGGIVAFADGGPAKDQDVDNPVVGYNPDGTPITRADLDQSLSALDETSESDTAVSLPPRETPWQIRQAEKEEHREGGQQLAGYIGDAGEWAKENPIDAASLALLVASGVGALPAAESAAMAGLRTLGPKALKAARNLGPKALKAARNLYSKPNPAFVERVSKAGNRLYPAGVPERLFSPGRTAGTAAGLETLGHMFDGGEEQESVESLSSPHGQDDIAALTALTSGAQTPELERATPVVKRPAPAGIPAALPQIDEGAAFQKSLRSGLPALTTPMPTREEADALMNVSTDAVKQASPEVQNEYTRRLSELRGEQEDKLEALISFLQGFRGKTNFASGLGGAAANMSARDDRIKAEIMATTDKIETLKLKEREMGVQERQAGAAEEANRIREDLGNRQIESEEAQAEAERTLRDQIAREGRINDKTIAEMRIKADAAHQAAVTQDTLTREQYANLRDVYSDFSAGARVLLEAANDYTAGEEAQLSALKQLEEFNTTLSELRTQLRKPLVGGAPKAVSSDDPLAQYYR